LPVLDESWRPDRAGVLITVNDPRDRKDLPWSYKKSPAVVKFSVVDQGRFRAHIEPFISYMGGLIESGVPVFLAASTQGGHAHGKTFLNHGMIGAVLIRDYQRSVNELLTALDVCRRHPGERISLHDAS